MISVLRKELKYVMFKHDFARMRPALSAALHYDGYGGDFGYGVRSLYFDSVYDRDLYDTLDGLWKKAKIRLRAYESGGPIKLEFKQKEGTESRKESLLLTREEADRMQLCDYEFLAGRPEPTARLIYMRLIQGAYQPKTLLEFNREAYTYPDGNVRITFDSDLCATASGWDLFDPNPPWTNVNPPSTGVLEVKYSSLLPSFIKDLMRLDQSATSNSKYVQAREFYQFGGDE